MERERLIVMIEVAVISGLAVLLSQLKFNAIWPNGGSITLEMIPLILLAFRRGWKVGLLAGLVTGVVDLFIGSQLIHPIQIILDYPLPYIMLGFAAIFVAKGVVPTLWQLTVGIVFATVLRFLSHFFAGVIYWPQYTPEGWNVPLWSAVYNASYLVPQMIITLVVLLILLKKYPVFFKARRI